MAITKQQAIEAQEFHVGRRTTSKGSLCNIWRRNGQTKTWKTRPEEYKVPVKFGMYSYDYLTQDQQGLEVYTADECPYCNIPSYAGYAEFEKTFPMLASRLSTLHCESHKPMGMKVPVITYQGTNTDGIGSVFCELQYGYKTFKFTVSKGVIRAFGRAQDMRQQTRMKLTNGYSTYDEVNLLKD